MSKSSKGSAFEREICKRLSMWWSDQERDDIFWRTQASGGRATIRFRRGKGTHGQFGDIQAVDPIGKPLTDLVSLELKRGYSGTSFADVIDTNPRNLGNQTWMKFFQQARLEGKNSGTKYWALVSRRNKKEAMIFIPLRLYNELRKHFPASWDTRPCPCAMLSFGGPAQEQKVEVVGLLFSLFLERVKPEHIKHLHHANRSS